MLTIKAFTFSEMVQSCLAIDVAKGGNMDVALAMKYDSKQWKHQVRIQSDLNAWYVMGSLVTLAQSIEKIAGPPFLSDKEPLWSLEVTENLDLLFVTDNNETAVLVALTYGK